MDNWTSILINCGIDSDILTKKQKPCPACGGKDRFSYDNRNGKGDYFCRGCGAGNGFELIKAVFGVEFEGEGGALEMARDAGLSITKSTTNHSAIRNFANDNARQEMQSILNQCVPASGTPAELYLQNRGLTVPTPVSEQMQCLYHPSVSHYDSETGASSRHPCMIWRVRSHSNPQYKQMFGISSQTDICIHKTYITEDGHKADITPNKMYSKKWIPDQVNAGCMFTPLTLHNNHAVLIAEGVETTIAAYEIMKQVNGVEATAYCMTNAPNMHKFGIAEWYPQHAQAARRAGRIDNNASMNKYYLPKYLQGKQFFIFADNDASFTGQLAANTCASNIYNCDPNTHIKVFTPDQVGVDWADIWQQKLPNMSANKVSIW